MSEQDDVTGYYTGNHHGSQDYGHSAFVAESISEQAFVPVPMAVNMDAD